MKVAITGATGTLGAKLVRALSERGDSVVALSRDAERARDALGGDVDVAVWADPQGTPPPADALARADAVVHLLGEPIAQRWTEKTKREIRESRVLATRNVVAALRDLDPEQRPRVLVSQSAVGWYGPRADEPIDETVPAATDFLATVCAEWEAEARAAEQLGLRVAITRTGVVLSEDGGALEKMLPPFKLGVGGPVAGGKQYVPWIHTDDVVGAWLFALDTEAARGPINVTAPDPVTNGELSKTLGRVLHRPAIAPVPGFAVKVLYGDMASIVTTGARVVPAVLQRLGYEFHQPQLEPALRAATGSS